MRFLYERAYLARCVYCGVESCRKLNTTRFADSERKEGEWENGPSGKSERNGPIGGFRGISDRDKGWHEYLSVAIGGLQECLIKRM